jgi:hypothetical protein
MPGSKKTSNNSNSRTKSDKKALSHSGAQNEGSNSASAQNQLRSFEKRFKSDSQERFRDKSPAYNQLQEEDASGSDNFEALSKSTNTLINALALAKQPVLIDDPSDSDEEELEVVDTPAFLSDQYFYYKENRPVGSNIARISLDRDVEIESYKFTNTGISISDDGYYQIDDEGVISLTLLGVLSQANDYNEGTNRIAHNIMLVDTSGNSCKADVIFHIVDETRKSHQMKDKLTKQRSPSGKSSNELKIEGVKGTVSGKLQRPSSASKKHGSYKLKTGISKKEYTLDFPLLELSRDKNRTRDESLILGLEHETSERLDRLVIVSELRDRSLSVSLYNKHVVTGSNTPRNYSLSRIDGGALPGWLRVNQSQGLLTGIVPGKMKKISVRIEFKYSEKVSIVRFITIDLRNGEVQELSALEPGVPAGISLFTKQLEANAKASGQDMQFLIDNFIF